MTERQGKYNAHPVETGGIHFDSKAEYNRYCELKLLRAAGLISEIEVHPRFQIVAKDAHGRALYYEADFSYVDFENNINVVEDVKGVKTAVYQLKRRLFLAQYPGRRFVEIR
jgi:hypothetical protein